MKSAKERAAGGVVERKGRVLLVKVTNLKGEVHWTFPKGHLEGREKPLEAALREVEEETGWRCRSVGLLGEVRYSFTRNGRPVDKTVRWYRMAPVKKTGKPDAAEIMDARWVAAADLPRRLSYPSDLRLARRLAAVTGVTRAVTASRLANGRQMSETRRP